MPKIRPRKAFRIGKLNPIGRVLIVFRPEGASRSSSPAHFGPGMMPPQKCNQRPNRADHSVLPMDDRTVGLQWARFVNFPGPQGSGFSKTLPRRGRNKSAQGTALGEGIPIHIQALKERYTLSNGMKSKLRNDRWE
jgi:hypothetical protein